MSFLTDPFGLPKHRVPQSFGQRRCDLKPRQVASYLPKKRFPYFTYSILSSTWKSPATCFKADGWLSLFAIMLSYLRLAHQLRYVSSSLWAWSSFRNASHDSGAFILPRILALSVILKVLFKIYGEILFFFVLKFSTFSTDTQGVLHLRSLQQEALQISQWQQRPRWDNDVKWMSKIIRISEDPWLLLSSFISVAFSMFKWGKWLQMHAGFTL